MTRKTRSQTELLKVSAHLGYEIWMLGAVARKLSTSTGPDDESRNAFLESFTVHLRGLVYFLWPEKPYEDDVIADDFFRDAAPWHKVRPAMSDKLKMAKKRVDKEVAHLTYARLLVSPEGKSWGFVELANELLNAMNIFRKAAPKDLLGPGWE